MKTRRERILSKLDNMVAAGRITQTEADRLRAAQDRKDFENGMRDISLRHAQATLTAAVESGQMTQDEATARLESLKSSDRPHSLRARLRH